MTSVRASRRIGNVANLDEKGGATLAILATVLVGSSVISSAAPVVGLQLSVKTVPDSELALGQDVSAYVTWSNASAAVIEPGSVLDVAFGVGLRIVRLENRFLDQCTIAADNRGLYCVLTEALTPGSATEMKVGAVVTALPDAPATAMVVEAAWTPVPTVLGTMTTSTTVLLAPGVSLGDLVWWDLNRDEIGRASCRERV